MTKLYCDTSNLNDIKYCIKKYNIDGVTTNPSIMRKEGVKNYKDQCYKILRLTKNKPLSVEVFADKNDEIINQALIISKWSKSIYVKVPVINTKGLFLKGVIQDLNSRNIKINITAVFTISQLLKIKKILNKNTPVIISIFSGRIADNGINPEPIIIKAKRLFKNFKNVKILWASVREPFNLIQAERAKCHIITVPPGILKKFKLFNKNLNKYSQETVQTFYDDAKKSGYKI